MTRGPTRTRPRCSHQSAGRSSTRESPWTEVKSESVRRPVLSRIPLPTGRPPRPARPRPAGAGFPSPRWTGPVIADRPDEGRTRWTARRRAILADNYPPRGGPDGRRKGIIAAIAGHGDRPSTGPTRTRLMTRHRLILAAILCAAGHRSAVAASGRADDPGAVEFFEKSIRPLLAEKCQKCHGGEKTQAG